jgi:hypothetical protein
MAVGTSSILILTKHSNDTEAVTGLTAFCDDIFSRTVLQRERSVPAVHSIYCQLLTHC